MLSIITVPFSLLLRALSVALDSYGWALILFAVIVTVIRLPLDVKNTRSRINQSFLQPKIQALREKHADNQAKMQTELQKLYKEEGVKPLGGCVWMLLPMVIIFALFSIIRLPLTHLMNLNYEQIYELRDVLVAAGYSFGDFAYNSTQLQAAIAGHIRDNFAALSQAVPEIYNINLNFLGMDIGLIPNWRIWEDAGARTVGLFALPVISAGFAFLSQRLMTANNFAQQAEPPKAMKTMLMFMPLMSLWIGFTLPAAMSVYWIASSAVATIGQFFINRRFKVIYEAEKEKREAADRAKEAELARKREETERLRTLNATQENKATSKKKKQTQERERERQRLAAQRAAENGADDIDEEESPSRVGHRKHARGRAYDPCRYDETTALDEDDLHEDDNLDVFDESGEDDFED